MHPADTQTRDAFNTSTELSKCLVLEVRKELQMTQEVFGELIGLHPQNVSKAEAGRYRIDDSLRNKLLILREISAVPGVRAALQYVTQLHGGNDAFLVAQVIQKVVA